ncbi:hypothetical protein [Sphingomonas sp. S-NIH.Pt15_0812]|uniref:hypothetical protein n=1 Tax=Sphingomonas sp. S-NIH.Pt15_0812 TaxID=1920129 RepID=UPI002692EAB6
MIAALALLAAVHPALGTRDATCAPGENGPAFIVTVDGLKDRRGRLRLELYPANDADSWRTTTPWSRPASRSAASTGRCRRPGR